jgi:HlyD family secretion protein
MLPLLFAVLILLLSAALMVGWHRMRGSSAATPTPTSGLVFASGVANGAVACLGRIEPQDGVLQITAAYFEGRPQRVQELKVKQGDYVRAAQLLAVLDGKEQLQTNLSLAEARVDLARALLTQVKTGVRPSDIAAQQAQVRELQAALDHAQAEYHRYEVLHEKTDVSTAELDERRLAVQTSEQKLREAQERLTSISEVRATDVAVAESELHVAMAEAARARAQLGNAMVYSPVAGHVLKIHAYPGEEISPQGLLDLGKTDAMYVEAEVDEADIARVQAGQHAAISGDLFPGKLSGVVETVGTTIAKRDVLPLDPVSFADARIFNVRIRLDGGTDVSRFINGKVNVVIHP